MPAAADVAVFLDEATSSSVRVVHGEHSDWADFTTDRVDLVIHAPISVQRELAKAWLAALDHPEGS